MMAGLGTPKRMGKVDHYLHSICMGERQAVSA